MPSITLTVSNDEAARIVASLAGTPYPQTNAGVKAWLMDVVAGRVTEFEREKAIKEAVAALPAPVTVVIT